MREAVFKRALLVALTGLAFGFVGAPVTAQEAGRVTGVVTGAETMRPLDGAQVELVGTGLGALTNQQGRFLILNVPAGTYTAAVTMIGYATTEREVTVSPGGTAEVDFGLEGTALALDEIIVTGVAAEVRAREVGNSLDAVTSRDIENIPLRNSEDILSGRAPGVTVMTNSGQPGAGGTIKIRGVNTVSQDAQPLIYVDGVRIFNEPISGGWDARTGISPLQDIAADDIERIEVIKGAAATTLYGTEASSGVIQIFTKQGVSGDARWTAEVGLGLAQMGEFGPDDSQLFAKCSRTFEGMDLNDTNDNGRIDDRVTWTDPTCPARGTWFDDGMQQNYNLSVRGGVGDLTYFVSGNFSDNESTLPNAGSKDGGFRANFGFSPAEDLGLRLSTAYTKRDVNWVNDGNNADGFLLNVGRGYRGYLQGGLGDVAEECAAITAGGVDFCSTNGYLFEPELTSATDRFTTGLTVEYSPWESISNRFTVGWDYLRGQSVSFFQFGYINNEGGYFWDESVSHTKLSLDYAGSWQADFGEDIASTFSWGGQIFRDRHRWTELDVSGFAGPGDPTWETGSGAPDYWGDEPFAETNAGFFLQELIGFQDRLFITGGLRVDGNSAFGDDFGLQMYPKVSVAYILSDYDFWPSSWFETMKLRGAVGTSGKAPGTFARLRTWTPVTGFESEPGFTPGAVGNDDLGPETTREIEVGFDASLFSGRVGVEATYFDARTSDALVGRDLPASLGFTQDREENVGELQNRGWEFQLTGGLFRNENIDWRVRGNLSFLESNVIDLDGDPTNDETSPTEVYTGLKSYIREGEPFPVYIGDAVQNPNEFAEPVIEETVMGPVYPTKLIGLGSTLSIGQAVTLDALVEYQGGHYLPNYTGYQNARRGVWTDCYEAQEKIVAYHVDGDATALDDVSALMRARCAIGGGVDDGYNSDYWVEKADFWKVRNLSLSWNVPNDLLRGLTRSATVTVAARNLYTWTDYSGTDPEVQDFVDQNGATPGGGDFGRRDYYQIPSPRTYSLSFRVGF